MKGIYYMIRVLLLFLFAFALSRLIFAIYFFHLFSKEPTWSILAGFYYALRIDISTACYLLLFPALFLLISSVFPLDIFAGMRRVYVLFILLANAMITTADLGLYQEWGVKMNYRALSFLQHPSEVLNTATTGQLTLFVVLTVVQTAVCFALYYRLVKPNDHWQPENRFVAFLFSILLVPLLILGLRGGLREVPVQASDAFYSTNQNLNWVAANTLWTLGQSIAAGSRYGLQNPYPFYDKKEARKVVDNLYALKNDSTVIFLKDQHPNIVLLVFEGWNADLVCSISQNKEHAAAPYFDQLASQGLLFTNCIASGERSDQGLAAVLSSFPSLPLSSVVNYPEKVDQLPSLLKPVKDKGYRSLFLFGGQLSYGNLKALIYHNGFDKIIEEKDIDPKIHRGRLGVHDEYTFNILSHELNTIEQPFFAGFFTQSTHFSYDYPKDKMPLPWAGTESDYANSMFYSDSCLGDFFAKARRQPWYANTLFILVADHSHVLPWNNDHKNIAMHHIPLLFFGEVIKDEFRGATKNQIASQQDICATLLSQMHLPHTDFKWSKDLMNPDTRTFAYWTFTDGFGFIRSSNCAFEYDLGDKKILSSADSSCDSSQIKREGLSYLQTVFEDFIATGKSQK